MGKLHYLFSVTQLVADGAETSHPGTLTPRRHVLEGIISLTHTPPPLDYTEKPGAGDTDTCVLHSPQLGELSWDGLWSQSQQLPTLFLLLSSVPWLLSAGLLFCDPGVC